MPIEYDRSECHRVRYGGRLACVEYPRRWHKLTPYPCWYCTYWRYGWKREGK